MNTVELQSTIETIVSRGRGILAADESTPTITKRFAALDIASSEESRRRYREILFTAPSVEQYISGIILFEETLGQKTSNGQAIAEYLTQNNIVPGIKVDKGIIDLASAPGDKITRGLDHLGERLTGYKEQGARFTKWRAVLPITDKNPGRLSIQTNSEVLARYAAIAQHYGFVPIVEPEVLIDGDHTIERCAEVSECVWHELFHALHRHHVALEYVILKPSMIIAGKDCAMQASPEQVAEQTFKILKRTVPAAVPTINFLSGGQTAEQASLHLQLMNEMAKAEHNKPWNISFSYARALQGPAMAAWAGQESNAATAQQAFIKRAKLNSLASQGEYRTEMERD